MKQISPRAHTPRRTYLPTKRKVLWASWPFFGQLGLYIGVAYEAGTLSVAVQTAAGSPRWIKVTDALSEAEAAPWATFGFRRQR